MTEEKLDYYLKVRSNEDVINCLTIIEKQTNITWCTLQKPTEHEVVTDPNYNLNIKHLVISPLNHLNPEVTDPYFLYMNVDDPLRLMGPKGQEIITLSSFINLINELFDNKPPQDLVKQEINQSMWNTKCPICKSDAYQGIGFIECSKGCC